MIDKNLLKSTESKLKIHAKALGLAPGSSDIFIKKSIISAEKSLKNREIVPKSDFNRAISKELKKYNTDLAYVFENYDKII